MDADFARDIFAADLDGDGDMDVLSASRDDDKIAWYENIGGGQFGAQNIISSMADGANNISASDLDGDSDMDVLCSAADGLLIWYENDGIGQFEEQPIISTELMSINSVYSADLDGDGDIDVIAASAGTGKIAWFENYGEGVFGPQQIISDENSTLYKYVQAGDMDGDGDIDIISNLAIGGDDELVWYENQGGGQFDSVQTLINELPGGPIFVVDLDEDGDIDVLSASIGSNLIAWHENIGSNSFADYQVISNSDVAARCIRSADLDGDGDLDVLTATRWKVSWYENMGDGHFGIQKIILESNDVITLADVADIDGDGDMDVLCSIHYETNLMWIENQGDGMFGIQHIISDQASGAQFVCSADLDGDGDLDVVYSGGSQIKWFENLGLGVFEFNQTIAFPIYGVKSVCASDLDGDGDLDVLNASSPEAENYDHKIAWFQNQGDGLFGSEQVISTFAEGANSVLAADFDLDGDMDVGSASYLDDKIAWYENTGDGAFSPELIISIEANGVWSVYSIDLDGDGDLDLISASFHDNKIAWYENLGDGLFGFQIVVSNTVDGARFINSVDIDGDGDHDIISTGNLKTSWYENLSGEGCIDPLACNYDVSMWIEDGSCCYVACGCTDSIAENYDEFATCDDYSCQYIYGCMDSIAENYDPMATMEDFSCEYIVGCIDIQAINYNPLATMDSDSCYYNMEGIVFHDTDENGVLGGNDYGLPFQEIQIFPEELTVITNDSGQYNIELLPGVHTLQIDSNPLFPFNTTPDEIEFEVVFGLPGVGVNFGISDEEPLHGISIDLYPPDNGYTCDELINHNICFRNMGNLPINGVVELEYESLFQGYNEITPIDSAEGNKVWLSFDNLLPGQMFFYDVELHTPTVDLIGQFLTSTSRIWGMYEGDTVAYGEKTLEMELTCAYDPNDKQVFPIGYSEEHYIANDTILEYLIRFQNTGNAPATDVRIKDTLDVNLDINTFQLVANSHSVFTTIDPNTREIDFFFQDIQLPDSVNSEPESHGLVSFKIRPDGDLPLLTELNNSASIFFDNNPPIFTNTT